MGAVASAGGRREACRRLARLRDAGRLLAHQDAGASVEDIKKLEFEAMASPAEIAGVLSRLADGFRSKILHVS